MPKSMIALIPDVNSALQLKPEELAGLIIEYLNSLTPAEQQQLNRHNFLTYWGLQDYPQEAREKLQFAFAEAWAWLERDCFDCPQTRSGREPRLFHNPAWPQAG